MRNRAITCQTLSAKAIIILEQSAMNLHQNQGLAVPPELKDHSQIYAKSCPMDWTHSFCTSGLCQTTYFQTSEDKLYVKIHCVSKQAIFLQWKGACVWYSKGWWKQDGNCRHAAFLILVIWLRCPGSLYSQRKDISCSLSHPELSPLEASPTIEGAQAPKLHDWSSTV